MPTPSRRSRTTLSRGWRLFVLIASALMALATGGFSAAAASAPEITVCDTCLVRTIADAVARAEPGARIIVRGGVYPGSLMIDRSVALMGVDHPVIDGGGHGSVVKISAPDVTLQGFTVRGTGDSLDREDTAILVDAQRATISGNVIEDALFGIYLKNAHGSRVLDNIVRAKPLPVAERGDGIRIWYSNDVTVERNRASGGRDVILWFSHDGVVRDNVFNDNRYALHLMFSDNATIQGNSLSGSSVGLYVMYSRETVVVGNTLVDNHGPSGTGIGLKGDDNGRYERNRVVNNRVGVRVDESARELTASNVFRENVLAYNGTGVALLPNAQRDTFVDNDFIDNTEQVGILGAGTLSHITWTFNGRGNYWSDYVGYDADGDGIGDVPYRSQHLFESLMDRHPALRLFLFSPAVTAIDFAARAFPAVRPETKLVDTAPLTHPVEAAALPTRTEQTRLWRAMTGIAGVVVGIGAALMIGFLRRRPPSAPTPTLERPVTHGSAAVPPSRSAAGSAPSVVRIEGLTKRYGRATAVDRLSMEVRAGETVALWGPNGAGKTTVLRCLLGIAKYEGSVLVDGRQPRTDGRLVRGAIGYVPQELPVPATMVGEMARFIASLKRAPEADAMERLRMLGVYEQLDKTVSALSGGMRQRLALALALIGSPSILLLDEPTANLDARGRSELLELLRRLKHEGMTMVFSSHRPEDVLMLADRILVIDRGVLRRELTPQVFLEEMEAHARLVLYVGRGGEPAAVAALNRLGCDSSAGDGVVEVMLRGQSKGRVIGALARAGVDVDDFEVEWGTWTGQS